MFVPIPTDKICDLSSSSSRYIAQAVCRKWQNFKPNAWHIIPEIIDLRPDGTGTVSSSYNTFTDTGLLVKSAAQEFTWMLGRDGPYSMESIDLVTLYETMPKLMKSTKAWTYNSWSSDHGLVPAYIRIELTGRNSLETEDPMELDFRSDTTSPGVYLPAEIIEEIFEIAASEDVAASDLLGVCKWSRELVLYRRRRERFALLTKRFAAWGLAFWMTCGHFVPPGNPKPTSVFGFHANVFKFPAGSGYSDFEIRGNWDRTWDKRFDYFSCELPIPKQPDSTFWRILQGEKYYDEHPEVAKTFHSVDWDE